MKGKFMDKIFDKKMGFDEMSLKQLEMTLHLNYDNNLNLRGLKENPKFILDHYLMKDRKLIDLMVKYPEVFKDYRNYYDELIFIYNDTVDSPLFDIVTEGKRSLQFYLFDKDSFHIFDYYNFNHFNGRIFVISLLLSLKRVKFLDYYILDELRVSERFKDEGRYISSLEHDFTFWMTNINQFGKFHLFDIKINRSGMMTFEFASGYEKVAFATFDSSNYGNDSDEFMSRMILITIYYILTNETIFDKFKKTYKYVHSLLDMKQFNDGCMEKALVNYYNTI